MNTPLVARTPWGLRIDTALEQIEGKEDKPIRYIHTFHVEPITYKDWVDEHKYMADGPMQFTSGGIEVMFPGGGVEAYDRTEFFINHRGEDGNLTEKIGLNLMAEEGVTFVVYRDVFNPEDWIVQLIE